MEENPCRFFGFSYSLVSRLIYIKLIADIYILIITCRYPAKGIHSKGSSIRNFKGET